MPPGKQQTAELTTESYGGINTALQFSQIPRNQSPRMKNAWMSKVGAISKRPGTVPVTSSALGNPIKCLTVYNTGAIADIIAAAGTTLYKYNGATALTGLTMTNPLNSADIFTVAFTDAASASILFITDGAAVKRYNGTDVANVTPAASDASPNPPNDLVNINLKGPKYCWVHYGHVMISDGKDIVWYSKRFTYDYFPSVQFERWVKENDYITGCGVTFNGVCLIPMRRGWAILTGTQFDNGTVSDGFNGNQFLNTGVGNIAPRSVQRITYPTGQQSIAFLSDDGVYEIYETSIQETGSRLYSTRALMKDKIDFEALGLTDAEKTAAVGYFDANLSLYLLSFKQGTTDLVYAFDVRNGEWYPWDTVKASGYARSGNTLYYAGSEGHLKKFDRNLYSDWTDSGKTAGTPVYFQRYSPALSLEFSGYESVFDYYLVEAKQWNVPSSLDIKVIFTTTTVELLSALKNEIFVWGTSKWGQAKWANVNYTDIVNQPNELIFHKKAKYSQVLWENNRDEPVEIYKDRFKGRVSGR